MIRTTPAIRVRTAWYLKRICPKAVALAPRAVNTREKPMAKKSRLIARVSLTLTYSHPKASQAGNSGSTQGESGDSAAKATGTDITYPLIPPMGIL